MNTKDIELTAVIDRNLEDLIRELDLDERLKVGDLLCAECGKVITMENLGAIELRDNEAVVYCDEFIYKGDGDNNER